MLLRRRLKILFAAHAVCVASLAASGVLRIAPTLVNHALFTLSLCHICLLGIWLGLRLGSPRSRRIAAAAGIAYLAFLPGFIIWLTFPWNAMGLPGALVVSSTSEGVIALVRVTAVALAIRVLLRDYSWRRYDRSDAPGSDSPGLQFSIVHLLSLMAETAVLLAAAQSVRSIVADQFGSPSAAFPALVASGAALLVRITFSVVVSLLSVWAALGPGAPSLRIMAAVVMAGCMALISPYLFTPTASSYVAIPLVVSTETLLVIASLLVLRSCGFRLLGPAHAASQAGGTGSPAQ